MQVVQYLNDGQRYVVVNKDLAMTYVFEFMRADFSACLCICLYSRPFPVGLCSPQAVGKNMVTREGKLEWCVEVAMWLGRAGAIVYRLSI